MNVLAYMKYPDMLEHAMNGVRLGSMIGSLPKEGQQNALQMAQTAILKEGTKATQARLKAILATPVDPSGKTKGAYLSTQAQLDDYNKAVGMSGISSTPQGTSANPFAPIYQSTELGLRTGQYDTGTKIDPGTPGYTEIPPIAAPTGTRQTSQYDDQ